MIDIILPVYKEQENIEKVLDGIKKFVKTPHTTNLVFYDNLDPTIPVVEKIKERYSNLNLFIASNGKGLKSQYLYGIKNTKSPLIIIMMSDLSDNPKDIDRMVKKIENGYDFVCASRYMPEGRRMGGSKFKAFLSWFGCRSLYVLTGLKTHDATNAFKCFRRDLLSKIKIESKSGYELPLELIIKTHLKGYRITEIPTTWKERKSGYSKFRIVGLLPNYLRWYIFGVKEKFIKSF